VLGLTGVLAGRRPESAAPEPIPPGAGPNGLLSPHPAVTVEFSADLLGSSGDGANALATAAAAMRRDLWLSTGVPVADVAVLCAPLSPGEWRIVVDGAPAASGVVPLDRALCLAREEDLQLAGLTAGTGWHPLTGVPAAVIAIGDAGRAEALGAVLDPPARALAEALAALRRCAHLLVGVQEVQALLDSLEASAPALVREVARQLPPALIGEIFRRLLEEGVSVRPLRAILDALLAAPPGSSAAALAEACRRSLARHIAYPLLRGRSLEALLLAPAAEVALRDALNGGVATLAPARVRELVASVESGLAASPHARALLAPGDVRRALRDILAQRFPGLAVLGYDELPADLSVRPVGCAAFSE